MKNAPEYDFPLTEADLKFAPDLEDADTMRTVGLGESHDQGDNVKKEYY
jgi:hypothetical protein